MHIYYVAVVREKLLKVEEVVSDSRSLAINEHVMGIASRLVLFCHNLPYWKVVTKLAFNFYTCFI